MRREQHLLRDVFWLTLPVVAVFVYLTIATIVSFYNAEIVNFHGDPVGPLRVAAPQRMLEHATSRLLSPRRHRYLPLPGRRVRSGEGEPEIRTFHLRIRGTALDALDSAIPLSAKTWQSGWLDEDGRLVKVRARYRGQLMRWYFFRRKNWKPRYRPFASP